MGRVGKRRKLAPGIYADADPAKVSVCAKVYGTQFERRVSAQTALPTLIQARRDWIAELRGHQTPSGRHTLRGDVKAYLAVLSGRRRDNARFDLEPWIALYGTLKRTQLTPQMVRHAMAGWLRDGKAPSTINHRRQELINLYRFHGAKVNPAKDAPRAKVPRPAARGVPMAVVRCVLSQMPYGSAKIRLRVMAHTGLPPSIVARLSPHDLDTAARTLYVAPRRKGRGVPGATIPITRRATAALRAFFKRGLTGTANLQWTSRDFHAALVKARKVWKRRHGEPMPEPERFRPYDVRHAFITHALLKTGDIHAVAHLARHSSISMTQHYAEAGVLEAARRAVAKMA